MPTAGTRSWSTRSRRPARRSRCWTAVTARPSGPPDPPDSDLSEPPLALLVVPDRLEQVLAAEVGPEHGREPELGVGRLPHQEVRDAHLPRGTDEQIRVG